MATEFAPAKVNLTLHITGQRADGYHLLDSLVGFVGIGDWVTVAHAGALSLQITGPMAAHLAVADDNLVLRAARLMGVMATIVLEKALPVASGIGGGSADAAATLRALSRLSGRDLPDAADVLSLGADVPVCMASRAVRMRGVGEVMEAVPPLPDAWLVLVNPMLTVPTPAVFRALTDKNGAAMPATLPGFADAAALGAFIRAQRNDLEAPAIALAPQIADARAALTASRGCLAARMSGSGATCFGLFADEATARKAQGALAQAQPGWWVACGALL